MFGECCPECGHLLSANRSKCPYCGWDDNFDQLSYALKLENDLAYDYTDDYRPDQLPGF